MVYLPTKLGSFKGVDKCGNPIECLGVYMHQVLQVVTSFGPIAVTFETG